MARYTDEFRASAVLMLQAAGYKPNGEGKDGALMQVSNKLKVPHSTLGRWYRADRNPPPSNLVQEKKQTMNEALIELFDLHAAAAHDSIKDAGHHEVMGGIKITIEALLNLAGQGPAQGNNGVNIYIAESHNYLDPAETAPGTAKNGTRIVEVQRSQLR